jgi:hypothetical protein
MVRARASRRLAIVAVLVAATLWYLRDPAWIANQTTGMWDWEQDAGGMRYRWTNSHASFFVPSDATQAHMRVATTFDEHGREPMLVTISVDDVLAARVVLTDASWREVAVPLPTRGSRHQRRIDVRTNGTREDLHAIRISEAELTRAPR